VNLRHDGALALRLLDAYENTMTTITLIRHGQANSTARDELGYDRLSSLGQQQATWLGEHLRRTGETHLRLFTGTLRRHVETADAMATGLVTVRDPRLNELAYFTLAQLMEAQHDLPIPSSREEFVSHLPEVFAAWRGGRINGAPESFDAFETRVGTALEEIRAGHGPALVVTSGGLISMAMRLAPELDINAMAKMALAIMNTSLHRFHPIGTGLTPVLFNAVPHLETPDRQFAQTHL
jgi:broad specificity phosphatase PhoE